MAVFDQAWLAPGAEPTFPPLLHGERVAGPDDPFAVAVAAAAAGQADPGTVFWSDDPDIAQAALVLAPEVGLGEAMAMVFAVGCGLNDALGALAPPETAFHHVWPDRLKANGALCGVVIADADGRAPGDRPEWLVVGFALSLAPHPGNPGDAPDLTSLTDEGCVGLAAPRLIESWSRHTLVWINRWEDEGFRPLHEAWLARAEGHRGEITLDHRGIAKRGRFLGLDESGNLLLETGEGIEQLSLLVMLGHRRRWPPGTA